MLRIKEVAKSKNISLEQLAEVLQINRVTLSRTINGNPTVETLLKIAKALDVDVSELFYATKLQLSKYEYEVITYDGFQQKSHEEYLNDKAKEGQELVSVVQFTAEDGKPCFRFYFKREIKQ